MKMEDSMFRELMEGTGLLYLLCKAGSYELVAVNREFREAFPELNGRVSAESNELFRHYMRTRGLEGYWQEADSATGEMIPAFDGTGV